MAVPYSNRGESIQASIWYFAGKPVTGPKFIALGRRNWYTAFANHLTQELGTKVYLCDFMDWLDETRPEESLFYFIQTSERIDIHLKEITKEDLKRATVGVGRRVFNREELRIPHMTGWEINQVFHNGYIHKTYWHVSDSMNREDAHQAMGTEVPMERILENRLKNLEYMGARKMAAQEIFEYYKATKIPPLERLIQRLLEISWIKKLQFFESYGTFMIGVHGQTTNRYTGTVEISVHHNGIYIVQVYDAKNRVLFWDRNVDIQRIGRILIELIKKG